MAEKEKLFGMLPSSTQERIAIVSLILALIVGLAWATWNIIDNSERGLADLKKVKIRSLVEPEAFESKRSDSEREDEQVALDCQKNPYRQEVDYASDPITDKALEYIARQSAMTTLDISGTDTSDKGIAFLENSHLVSINVNGTRVTDKAVSSIVHIKSLRAIECSDTALTDAGICLFKELPDLRELKLEHTKIDNKVLPCLAEMKNLADLDLGGTAVTEDGISVLRKMPRLTYLQLFNIKITNKGAQALATFPGLARLELRDSRLTDVGLKTLSTNHSLKDIYLMGTLVSDEGLNCLKNLPLLKEINLTDCQNITDQGIAKLKAALPHLKIKHNPNWRDMSGEDMMSSLLKKRHN